LTFHPNQAEARMERSGNHTSSFAVIQLSKTKLLGQRPPFYVRELWLSTRNPFSRPARTRRRRGGCSPCTPVPRGPGHPSTGIAPRQHGRVTNFVAPGLGLGNPGKSVFQRSTGSSMFRRTASRTDAGTPFDSKNAPIPPAPSTAWKTTSSHSGWTIRPGLLRTDCI